ALARAQALDDAEPGFVGQGMEEPREAGEIGSGGCCHRASYISRGPDLSTPSPPLTPPPPYRPPAAPAAPPVPAAPLRVHLPFAPVSPRVHAALALVQLLFASLAIFGRVILLSLPAGALVLVRIVGAAVVLLAVQAASGRPWISDRRDVAKLAGLGILGVAC